MEDVASVCKCVTVFFVQESIMDREMGRNVMSRLSRGHCALTQRIIVAGIWKMQ